MGGYGGAQSRKTDFQDTRHPSLQLRYLFTLFGCRPAARGPVRWSQIRPQWYGILSDLVSLLRY